MLQNVMRNKILYTKPLVNILPAKVFLNSLYNEINRQTIEANIYAHAMNKSNQNRKMKGQQNLVMYNMIIKEILEGDLELPSNCIGWQINVNDPLFKHGNALY